MIAYRSCCPGGSIRWPVRPRCWSAGSCDPASWPPRLWRPHHSSEPEAAPWQCSTSPGPLGQVGGCTGPAVPPLRRGDRRQKKSCNGFYSNEAFVEVSLFTAGLLNYCCTLATIQSVNWLHLQVRFSSRWLPEVIHNVPVNSFNERQREFFILIYISFVAKQRTMVQFKYCKYSILLTSGELAILSLWLFNIIIHPHCEQPGNNQCEVHLFSIR